MSIDLLKKLIVEMSRYKKETGKSSWGAEDLKKYLPKTPDGPNDLPQYAFTMTQLNKVGVNPGSEYNTPLGVYFYPLTHKMYKSLIDDDLPFAGQMENVNLVKLNNLDSPKWLRVSDRNQSINLEALQMKAYNFFDDSNKKIARVEDNEYTFETALERWGRWTKRESKFSSTSLLFSFCAFLIKKVDLKSSSSKVAPGRRFNQVLRHLGFIGVYDGGKGVIHENEPEQLVALEPSAYTVIKSYNTNEIRKDKLNVPGRMDSAIFDAIFFIEEAVFDFLGNEKVMSKKLNMLKNLFTRDEILSYYLKNLKSWGVTYAGGLFSAIAIIDNDSITNKFLDNWEIWSKNPRFHEFVSNLKDKNVDPTIEIKLKKLIKKSVEKLNMIVSRDAGTPFNFSNETENQYLEKQLIDFFMDALK
jgi:hypothetical protein